MTGTFPTLDTILRLRELRRGLASSDILNELRRMQALEWVTVGMIPQKLNLIFLSTRSGQLNNATEFLMDVLPEHVSCCLVNSLGIDFVLRGALPVKEWVDDYLFGDQQRQGAKIFRDVLELIVQPIGRYRWREIQAVTDGANKPYRAEEVDEQLLASNNGSVRFIYDPSKLPVQSVYIMIRAGHEQVLNRILREHGAPVREMYKVVGMGANLLGGYLAEPLKSLAGIAVCEFDDFVPDGDEFAFSHSLRQVVEWRREVLQKIEDVNDAWFVPSVSFRESYEVDQEVKAQASGPQAYPSVPFAHASPDASHEQHPSIPLELRDFVICGPRQSGRTVLGAWAGACFLRAGYCVVYVTRTEETDVWQPTQNDRPPLVSHLATLRTGNRSPLTCLQPDRFAERPWRSDFFYTEASTDKVEWLLSAVAHASGAQKTLVLLDEVGGVDHGWLQHLGSIRSKASGLRIGLVCRDLDDSRELERIARGNSLLVTRLPDPSPMARVLSERAKLDGHSELSLDDLYRMEMRSFAIFPGNRFGRDSQPVRAALPDFSFHEAPRGPLYWIKHDVFLSYNHRDKEHVDELHRYLGNHGLQVFIDYQGLEVGQSWEQALPNHLYGSRVTVVCIGKRFAVGFQDIEIGRAISMYAQSGKKVIPLLLPGAPEPERLPSFLTYFQALDLRQGVTMEGLDRLYQTITQGFGSS